MSRYRTIRSNLIVTKPDGSAVVRDAIVYHDVQADTFGILLVGDSPLKNYAFEVLQKELKRARDSGELVSELPKV